MTRINPRQKLIHSLQDFLKQMEDFNFIDDQYEEEDIVKVQNLLKLREKLGVLPFSDLSQEQKKIGHQLKREGVLIVKDFPAHGKCFAISTVGWFLEQYGMLY